MQKPGNCGDFLETNHMSLTDSVNTIREPDQFCKSCVVIFLRVNIFSLSENWFSVRCLVMKNTHKTAKVYNICKNKEYGINN